MSKIREYFDLTMNFLSRGVWNMRLKDLSGHRYFLIRQLRIYLLAVKGFYEDKCQLRASALTFYSLLSVVPVLAMAFGIAKGFNLEARLETELKTNLAGQQEVLTWLIEFANKMLENTKGSLIAGLGFIILFWSVVKVLSNIEESFNDVWRIKKPRTWGRKFSDYTALMIFAPILLIGSSGATVFLKSNISGVLPDALFELVGPFIMFLLNLAPFFLVWILFTLLYTFMPNTHVKFKSGLLAGIIAGTIYQMFQVLYIEFQGMVTTYNAVYGSFAALPLFLMWLQLSWLVVLFGAEISFAEQNVENYEYEAETTEISYDYKRLLSLYVLNLIVQNFKQDNKPLCSQEISHQLEMPIRLVREILYNLNNAGLISELTTDKDKQMAYQPAFDINEMTVSKVIDLLEKWGSDKIPVLETEVYADLKLIIEEYRKSFSVEGREILLKDI
ncbi:YihY/virulence factor BrkB family protein [Marinifilum sp. D714]|uniref:YihY/virulence factor BrkB family protein n=1 Tax=Marinifilum sp. D714 TaxID=2937523 RepID=UPI0027C5DAC4|nr:YihY/virulence factor BrkB family protein [Marinifilum sp. D714]MDQ2179314.1 YihY/virulence factor BrkB family protein [Marinifilum sp. D714]